MALLYNLMKSLTSHVRHWVCSSMTERLGGSVCLILVCTNLYKIRSIKGVWRVCLVTSISSGYGCRIFSFRCLGPSFYKCFPFCLKTVLPALSSDIGKDHERLIVETAPCLSLKCCTSKHWCGWAQEISAGMNKWELTSPPLKCRRCLHFAF